MKITSDNLKKANDLLKQKNQLEEIIKEISDINPENVIGMHLFITMQTGSDQNYYLCSNSIIQKYKELYKQEYEETFKSLADLENE